MWLATNKRNGSSQRMTDKEKALWESSPYGKVWTFQQITPPSRAIKPKAVKTAKPKTTPKRKPRSKRTKTADS